MGQAAGSSPAVHAERCPFEGAAKSAELSIYVNVYLPRGNLALILTLLKLGEVKNKFLV